VTSSGSPRGTIVVSDPAGPRDVSHLGSSRTWIGRTGKNRRRVTTLTFVLRHGARVVFTVRQVSPVCHTVGRFSVRGHAGVNKVKFDGRVRGHQLQPGTYRLNARTVSGHAVQRAILVVLDSAPSREQLAALRAANVCASANGSASTTAFFSSSGATDIGGFASPEHVQRSLSPKKGEPTAITLGGDSQGGPAVASAVEKTARAIRPMLVALLAISILLLGLASLPQAALPDQRLNYALARHRIEIATFGAAALAAVIIAFAIG
jgi:hypothetical protein